MGTQNFRFFSKIVQKCYLWWSLVQDASWKTPRACQEPPGTLPRAVQGPSRSSMLPPKSQSGSPSNDLPSWTLFRKRRIWILSVSFSCSCSQLGHLAVVCPLCRLSFSFWVRCSMENVMPHWHVISFLSSSSFLTHSGHLAVVFPLWMFWRSLLVSSRGGAFL